MAESPVLLGRVGTFGMIRYAQATLAKLCELVDQEQPNWRVSAGKRTESIKAAGAYSDGAPSWSDIKTVFMRLQYNKCAFCEFPLGGEFAGKATQDIEHFRPKNAVKSWPKNSKSSKPNIYNFSTGGAGSGYYWLAYELSNYAAACKACNSARKSNYFPIASARGAPMSDIADLNAKELPLLIFPLGDTDDPESLITFEGLLARPVHNLDSHEYRRAVVTIDFFALNDREELLDDRFRVIYSLFNAVRIVMTDPDQAIVESARRRIADMISASGSSASCARAFLRLLNNDSETAWQYYLAAEAKIEEHRGKRRRRMG